MRPSHVQVLIDGSVAEELSLMELTVTTELNRHPALAARFRQLADSRRPCENDLGRVISVQCREESGGSLELFRGVVRRIDTEYELSGACNLVYHGVGWSWKLDVGSCSRMFRDRRAEEIIRTLLQGVPAGRIEARGGPYNLLQFAESNWSLLVRLADRHRCFVRVTPDAVDVLEKYADSEVVLRWRKEKSLRQFRTSGRLFASRLSGPNYDRATALSRQFTEIFSEPPSTGSLGALLEASLRASVEHDLRDAHYDKFLSRDHQLFEDELRLESERRRLRSVNGFGESLDCRVEAGSRLCIEGVGQADGVYGVYRVEHSWLAGKGYWNRFWCSPFATYLDAVRPAATAGSATAPSAQAALPSQPSPPKIRLPKRLAFGSRERPGVVIGRVVGSSVAKAGARVKVKYLWEDCESETAWAPVIAPHAGGKRGIFFMPEVGDEVAIMFEQGDPSRPVVIGSLWNGAHEPPNDDLHGGEADRNDIKRIVTKSGNRLVFDDLEGDEAVVLATPSHIRISMFEGDQTLLIHSDGDILIHAGGTIHMRCNQFLREVGPVGDAPAEAACPGT